MALPPEKIQERAIKAGIRASKRRHRRLKLEELLKLKIQILPNALRWALVILGLLMIVGAFTGWPFPRDNHQVLLGIGGGLLAVFGCFGVMRTLETVFDTIAAEGVGLILEGILSAIGHALGL